MKQLTRISLLIVPLIFVSLNISSCTEKTPEPEPEEKPFIFRAADLSFLPEMEEAGIKFYDSAGLEKEMLTILKESGLNTVRIRIWHTPADKHSGFNEVKEFSHKVKSMGLKVWITVHYSDTWADPGHQTTPSAWQGLEIMPLSDSVYNYTARIMDEISPDFIQIGNEINGGMLWPAGKYSNMTNLKALLRAGSKAVRDSKKDCKIMFHYAGTDGAEYMLQNLQSIDYDIIGISYYPNWHGKDLNKLQTDLISLSKSMFKPVMIAETSYPFTFGWNDWTNNVVGSQEQAHPDFPGTPGGQLSFLEEIRRISTSDKNLVGFAYWGGEWVSFKGPQANNGSSWENMALFDFDNKALPALRAFRP